MEETISERLARLEQNYVEALEKPKKPFKLPLSSRIANGKVMKKEWVHVFMIKTNGSIEIKTCKIDDSTVKFGDYFYDARAGNILRYKKMPVLILKEWNVSPEAPPESHAFNAEKDYHEASRSGRLTASQKLILTKMKMEAIKPKMNFNPMTIIIIAAVLGGGYYLLNSMGVI